jgi:hypothetical protein
VITIAAPRPVSTSAILKIVYAVARGPGWREYPLIARGIADAATNDPLFPKELTGAEATAALLIAYAWDASRLLPYGRSGEHMGLYRIRPPTWPATRGDLLIDPRQASLVAVDLLRQSLERCRAMPIDHRLSWILDLGHRVGTPPTAMTRADPIVIGRSERIMRHAIELFDRHFDGPAAISVATVQPNQRRLLGDGTVVDSEPQDTKT